MLQRLLMALALCAPALPHCAPRLAADDVEAWADATFQRAFEERRFSGLAISVVQDDAVLFTRGYGYADYARKIPMDPQRTRLRIGSITKTFTAVAIAQLLQRGQIHSIDDPVNLYLRRDKLPRVDGKDITLRHLLTHTAGFDSRAFGLATQNRFRLPLSAEEVAARRQPVVRKIGDRAVYSNYGTALLAVVVEDVTGQPIARYFDEHIFMPLGMSDSVLNVTTQPSQDLAVPYRFLPSGAAQAQRFMGVHPFFAPVGAIESTPADMARYMIANLQEGRDGSAAVLDAEHFRMLHRRLAGNHPAVSGFGMIFIEFEWNGVRFFGHGGDWPGFHSILLMAPQSRTGFFISCLCDYPQAGLVESVLGSERMKPDPARKVLPPMTNVGVAIAFLERFWGARQWPRARSSRGLDRFSGTYWREFRAHEGPEKFLELLGGESAAITVDAQSPSGLRINGQGGFDEVAPGVFWNASAEPALDGNFWNSGLWAFTPDAAGKPHDVSPTFAIDSYARAGAMANPLFAMKVLALGASFALTGILCAFWPAGEGFARRGKWLPPLVAASLLAFVFVLLGGYHEGDGPGTALLLGESARFVGMSLLAKLVAVLALLMLATTWLAWRNGYWGDTRRGAARRVHFTLLAAAALGLTWAFAFGGLLGVAAP